MAKQSGLGDNLYVGGYDVSGDVGSINTISTAFEPLDVTTIDKSAFERLPGKKTGSLEFMTFFDDAVGASHDALKGLPTSDVIVSYFRGTALGAPAASCIGKQINYDYTRGNDGMLSATVQVLSNGYGLEWGVQGTAGKRTDTSATSPATGIDTTASASFGAQAYLHVFAFTGTSVTVKIQDSADNSSFADISPSLTFVAATGAGAQRVSVPNGTTLRRYLRVVTTGTFSNAVFSVVIVKNTAAVTF